MNLVLVECKKEYWEFVRLLRTNSQIQEGFFSFAEITKEQQEIFMSKNHHRYKICLLENNPVGYVGIINEQEITYCVHSDFSNQGIGTYMVREFTKDSKNFIAIVKQENIGSQRVFEKLGWQKHIYFVKKMNFNETCNYYNTDKGDKHPYGNGYASFYDPVFSEMRSKHITLCEIGVEQGNSLKTYYDYFPNAKIYGLDIADKKVFENDRITTRILDQSKEKDLDEFLNFCDSCNLQFDFILDDGSHDVEHQQLTFGKLFRLIKPGGFYIIEDLGSSHFVLGVELYGNVQTQRKINNNTIKFLSQRPFDSFWISKENLSYINDCVASITIFDTCNKYLPYSKEYECENGYPLRSITSIIKKKG